MKTKPTKSAAKKAPKLTPIIIGGETGQVIGYLAVRNLIAALPMIALKEHLRARSLPIPKDKATMVARLAQWAVRPEATFTISLY